MDTTDDLAAATSFHLFPNLPTELRLKIWRSALPGPRLVELTVMSPERPDVEYGSTQSSGPNLRWCWVINNAKSPTLLHVNNEAREVALKSYDATGAWEPSFQPWRRAYIDYSVDTLYFSALLYRALLFSSHGFRSKFDKKSIDIRKVRSLALASWPRIRQWEEPTMRVEAVQLLKFVLKTCPRLTELFLTMDGRATCFTDTDRLVDPTDEYPDYSNDETKDRMLELVELVVKEAKELDPVARIPPVSLKLMINGPEDPPIERRWFYGRACCETYRIVRPLAPLGKNAFEYFFD